MRGRHKVFLGMAAGVGKTYRMLQEGRADDRDTNTPGMEHGKRYEDVEARQQVVSPAPVVGERLLALVQPDASAQRLVRRAWRSAQRLGADLDVLWVKPPGVPDDGLAPLRAPAEVLILRPGFADQRRVTGAAVKGHF